MVRWRRWRSAAAALLLALVALRVRIPLDCQLNAPFPGVAPRTLAHFLADFSNYPHLGAWQLEREASNYSMWRYEVRYECGAGCGGRVEVSAHEAGASAVHRVELRDERCARLAPLPLSLCAQLEVHSEVLEDEARRGAVLRERARSWCGLLHLLGGDACAPAAARARHLRLLRRAFPAP